MKAVTFTADEINGKRDFDMVLYNLKRLIPDKDSNIKSITIHYEPFDWIAIVENRIEHNKVMLDLLKSGIPIDDVEGKTLAQLKEKYYFDPEHCAEKYENNKI